MTPPTLVLAGHSLRRIRGAALGTALLLGAFQFLLTQVANYLLSRQAFSALSALLPAFVQNMMGPSGLAFASFTGIVTFGYFHPVVIATLVTLTIAVATEPAAEVESRFVDLALARPLTRAHVITRTLVVFAVVTALVLLVMMISTETGLACCTAADAPRPAPRVIRGLAASLAALMACWLGITLLIASRARRRVSAGTLAGGLALATYLLDYLGRVWQPVSGLARLSPFHYFEPTTLVAGQPLSGGNIATLAGIAFTTIAAAYAVYSQRDI
ncbi:MAG TPA: hypothetical protein VH497_02665 [Vicinamibacterales bacterium]